MDLKTLMYLREAFLIRRYHTVNYSAIQDTVGHHTANVIGLLYFLYDDVPPLGVVSNALYHDCLELLTGDIPATAKWSDAQFNEALTKLEEKLAKKLGIPIFKMSEQETNLVRYADIMDVCLKSIDEVMVGNQMYFPILANGVNYAGSILRTHLKGHVKATELFSALMMHPHINITELIDEPQQQTH
jgi:5'-deoxynucleotidase YfbR-like HD superfamily hydrolase